MSRSSGTIDSSRQLGESALLPSGLSGASLPQVLGGAHVLQPRQGVRTLARESEGWEGGGGEGGCEEGRERQEGGWVGEGGSGPL